MEMLIAVALAGVLLTAVLSTSTNLLKSEKHVRTHKEISQDIYAVFQLIEKDIDLILLDND